MGSRNLHRNAYGTARDMDRFSYHYVPGTNKLDHVTDLGTDYNYLDIKTGQAPGTYSYNPIGQMTGDAAEGNFIQHDVYGMPTAVYWDAGQTTMKASYTYDESGQRIKKTNHSPAGQLLSETYYLRDAFGSIQETRLLEAGESAPTAQDITISGLGRIGFYDRTDGEHRYELTDHLGNIRVTFKEDQHGDAEVLSATDYYPYGMELPGRGLISSDLASAKGYQGIFAEKDRHLNWSTFDLRTYDGRLGRFHNEDPYGEFHSPFMAMGNNPLSFVDPTGGSTDPDCCPGYYLGSTPVYGSPPGSGGGSDGNIGWDDFVDVNRPAGWAFDRDAVYGPWHDDFLHGHFGSSAPDPEAHAQQQRGLVVDHFAEQGNEILPTAQDGIPKVDPGEMVSSRMLDPYQFGTFQFEVMVPDVTATTDKNLDWYKLEKDAEAFMMSSAMSDGPVLPFGDMVGLATYGAVRTGRVLFTVKTGTTVLGKYPQYIQLAAKINANRFNIPPSVWNKMTPSEQWAANVKFLDRAIARGDRFLLSNPVKNINDVGGFFRKELDYLIGKGYKLSKDGTQLIR